MLVEKKHKNLKDIQDSLGKLLVLWRNLLQETNEKGRGLEEAQDILEFNNQVDKVETWIRDKVIIKLILKLCLQSYNEIIIIQICCAF